MRWIFCNLPEIKVVMGKRDMKTGKSIMIFIASLVSICGYAQEKIWLWPIEGCSAGDGVLFVPQQYIDNELCFGELFIGGEEGTAVLAPADATV